MLPPCKVSSSNDIIGKKSGKLLDPCPYFVQQTTELPQTIGTQASHHRLGIAVGWVVQPGQQCQAGIGNPNQNDPTILRILFPAYQSLFAQTVHQPGNVGIPVDHPVGDVAALDGSGARSTQYPEDVVLADRDAFHPLEISLPAFLDGAAGSHQPEHRLLVGRADGSGLLKLLVDRLGHGATLCVVRTIVKRDTKSKSQAG